MKLIKTINPENASETDWKNYSIREASRAVVIDPDGKVALLYVAKGNYYKLPGGGIENSEDKLTALKRECTEEIGCDIAVTDEIGEIVEYRKFCNLIQKSYCYLAELKGSKGKPQFTQDEIEEGFDQWWLPIEEALSLLAKNEATNMEGKLYIVPRDFAFIERAVSLLAR